MGPITYSLCQKALIGPALWIAGLCTFPPLIENTALPLTTAGATVSAPFTVPVDLRYQFVLQFEFPSTEARLQDTLVGSRYQTECDTDPAALADKPEFGRPIPLRLVIRNAKDHSLVTDEQVTSLCVLGHAGNKEPRRGMGHLIPWRLHGGNQQPQCTNRARRRQHLYRFGAWKR